MINEIVTLHFIAFYIEQEMKEKRQMSSSFDIVEKKVDDKKYKVKSIFDNQELCFNTYCLLHIIKRKSTIEHRNKTVLYCVVVLSKSFKYLFFEKLKYIICIILKNVPILYFTQGYPLLFVCLLVFVRLKFFFSLKFRRH